MRQVVGGDVPHSSSRLHHKMHSRLYKTQVRAMSVLGKFITIEGGEGAGKSTNIVCVERYLRDKGIKFIKTREPGGTLLAEEVRKLLLAQYDEKMSEKTELLLMFAARAQHIQQKILPALQAGLWVVCDRFTDATYAYQGGGRGLSENIIAALEQLVQEGLQPDLTLLLDVDEAVGLARAGTRSKPDRFESENTRFFVRVLGVYRQRAVQYSQRFRVINAGQELENVQRDIIVELEKFMAAHGN